jgi:hypothetical protein
MDRICRRAAVMILAAIVAGATAFFGRPTDASSAKGQALPPLAWTTHAQASKTSALLFGRFNPRGHRTVIQFQYGRTRAYGRVTPTYPEEEWFGNEVSGEEEFTERLKPGTWYHYRIVARSSVGTAYGQDRAFRTKARDYRS